MTSNNQWVEYDIYEVDEDGAFEPFTGTFMTLEEAHRELQRARAQFPQARLVLVRGTFEVLDGEQTDQSE